MITLTTILVPTDFSEYSVRALDFALALGQNSSIKLHIIHVVEPLAYMTEWGAIDNESLTVTIEKSAGEELQKLAAALKEKGIQVSTAVLTGHPEDEIVRYAREQHVDVISMGTHGRRGVAHLLFGSTTERVLRSAPCPVLSVPLLKSAYTQSQKS